MELSSLETFILGTFIPGTFVPENFRPLELSFPKVKLAWNFRSLTLIITEPLILT